MKCRCGADAHPNYGSRCEDCWAQGARESSSHGHVPLHEAIKHPSMYGGSFEGPWRRRGRIVRTKKG